MLNGTCNWLMVIDKWEVVNGKWLMLSGYSTCNWLVVSGNWKMVNEPCKWKVVYGKWLMVNGYSGLW